MYTPQKTVIFALLVLFLSLAFTADDAVMRLSPKESDNPVFVYRFFNTVSGGHLYTISTIERDYIIDNLPEWSFEGAKFGVYEYLSAGTASTYRFFNTITGIHLYTISEIERDYIINNLPEYNYEGIKFYVSESLADDTTAVYRFFNHVRGGHLYTISETERDAVMQLPDWTYEGVPFYVYPLNAPVPRTGQTMSYRDGDDGDLQMGVEWPEPRFTDNGDGTVTDNLTGLMWTQNADIGGLNAWNPAIDFCNDLVHAGYSDWRLPNNRELHSLIDKGEYIPGLPYGHPFTGVQNSYWSSSTYAGITGSAWWVNIGYGSSYYHPKTDTYYVWPVRGVSEGIAPVPKTGQTISYRDGDDGDLQMGVSWPDPRFTDHGEGTVTDNLSGLMWSKNAILVNKTSWNNAIDWCNTLVYADYSDWRLPNVRELLSLVSFGAVAPSLPQGHPFTDINIDIYYWMSTTDAFDTDRAWMLSIWYGEMHYWQKTSWWYIWPVRGGQANMPNAPSNLQATAVSSSQINLSWTDNSQSEEGFKIERKTWADGSWSQIDIVGANVTTYSDSGLFPDTTYYYRVRAYISSGNSAYSNEAYATTFWTTPNAPSNLQATTVSSSQINLSWTDNSYSEEGFKIERKTGIGGSWSQIDVVDADVTAYNDAGLFPDTSYYYRVRAYNSFGDSDYSNEARSRTFITGATVPLPRTGVTTSYLEGDDGYYQMGVEWPSPRFTDHGEGTVTDNLTGLMWTQNANMDGQKTWDDAIDWCHELVHAGYSDWRLPNRSELHSLIDNSRYNPALPAGHPFTGVNYSEYWSSSTYAGITDNAWYVAFGLGRLQYKSKTDACYVWAVRGFSDGIAPVLKTGQTESYREGDDGDLQVGAEWPNPRFIDHGDGTVTDNLTGLMWSKGADLFVDWYWSMAINKCSTLVYAGYSDWRLPNIRELLSLIDLSRDNPSMMDGHPFTGIQSASYWSSTSNTYNTYYKWAVSIITGFGTVYDQDFTYKVWPVRGGEW